MKTKRGAPASAPQKTKTLPENVTRHPAAVKPRRPFPRYRLCDLPALLGLVSLQVAA